MLIKKLLLLSARNSTQAHVSLLKELHCRHLFTGDDMPQVISSIRRQTEIQQTAVPAQEEWLNDEPSEPYLYEKTFKEASYEPFVIVHTSGSTGLPKPIVVPHGAIAASDAYNTSLGPSPPSNLEPFRNKRCLLVMPLFHLGGLDSALAKPCYYGQIPVFPPFHIPINTDLVAFMHTLAYVQCSVLPPSIIEDLAKSRSTLEGMKRLTAIGYGGAPLSKQVGEMIRSYVPLISLLGSTETYCLPTEIVDQEHWDYMRFRHETGAHFVPDSDGLWELQVIRASEY